MRSKYLETNEDDQHRQSQAQGREASLRQVLKGEHELLNDSVPALLEPHEAGQFAQGDLNTDSG